MPISSPKYNNSAGRLLEIMSKIPTGQELGHCIPAYFSIPDAKSATNNIERAFFTYEGLQELQSLYLQFLAEMKKVQINDSQRTVLLNGLAGLKETIYPYQFNSGFRAPGPAEKSLLEVCATILPVDGDLITAEVDAIKASIRDLEKAVNESETPEELKKVLLEFVRLSRDSIDRYNIHGAAGLRKAFKQMLAETAELHFVTSIEQETEIKESAAWKKLLIHLNKFNDLLSLVSKHAPLLKKAGGGILSLIN